MLHSRGLLLPQFLNVLVNEILKTSIPAAYHSDIVCVYNFSLCMPSKC